MIVTAVGPFMSDGIGSQYLRSTPVDSQSFEEHQLVRVLKYTQGL